MHRVALTISYLERDSAPSHPGPARLRPELLPRVKVVEVLPAARHPAIPELEDDAAVDIEVLAVAHPAVVVDADDAAVVIR